jgi:hypothetical protein
VQVVQPENVVLELCRSRTAVMYDDDSECNQHAGGSNKTPNVLSLRCVAQRMAGSVQPAGLIALLLLLFNSRACASNYPKSKKVFLSELLM